MEVQVHNDVVEILIEPKKGKGDIFWHPLNFGICRMMNYIN
jgi:hypothetical protein